MYDLDYLNRRRRKRIAGVVGSIGLVGVVALGIVAFLGRFSGAFTVSVNNGSVKLALTENSQTPEDEGNSFLSIDSLPNFEVVQYWSLPNSETLDNEDFDLEKVSNYDRDTGELKSIDFFKYTFFLRNVGRVSASYNVNVTIDDSNGKNLVEILRVMLYDNDVYSSEHNVQGIYARPSLELNYIYDAETDKKIPVFREFVSKHLGDKDNVTNRTEDDHYRLATNFESDEVVTSYRVDDFNPGDARRYTVVIWLEGNDPQCVNDPPLEETIKLGVKINAYEN